MEALRASISCVNRALSFEFRARLEKTPIATVPDSTSCEMRPQHRHRDAVRPAVRAMPLMRPSVALARHERSIDAQTRVLGGPL